MGSLYEQGYKAGCIDTVKRCIVSNEAERKVIEAAKAWRQRWRKGIRFHNGDQAFAGVIDALQAAEGEE